MSAPSSVCLVILDGWGLAPPSPGNAVSLARTPIFDALWERYPRTTLTASGGAVGLPEGQMGNSEVGHLNLGAGAVVKQDLTLIDEAAKQPAFGGNGVLLAALRAARRVHLIGLVSDGGVHSSIEHLHTLIRTAAETGVEDLVIHAFTDGRDTLPSAGADFVGAVERWCEDAGVGRVASVVGRYFAMDRDLRWERVQQAYDLLAHGIAEHVAATGREAVLAAYERGETDEFIAATRVGAEGTVRPEDSVIAFNFRPDRMREISCALAEPTVSGDRPPRHSHGRPLHDADGVRRRPRQPPRRLPARAAEGHAAARHRRSRRAPAARLGDREVPARDVLLRRWRRAPRGRRAA
ncbi:MAG TPA: hypothetical protein VGV67_10765 [Solirubrobacteraceae bacterium]|nr:hypothetical protein [Solirubrobacteraceae bacterium]